MSTHVDAEAAALLDGLCTYFDSELERQENVLRVCRAQGEAAKALDREAIEHRTETLGILLDEAAAAERERLAILERLTPQLSADSRDWTLSQLIDTVPEPWKHRLAEAQSRLRDVAKESRATVASNAVVMRRSLRTVNGAIEHVLGPASGSSYTERGDAPQGEPRRSAVLNAQG